MHELKRLVYIRTLSPCTGRVAVSGDPSFCLIPAVDVTLSHTGRAGRKAALSDLLPLEVAHNSFHRAGVSKMKQTELDLRKPSQEELRQIREYLDDSIELEFVPQFEDSIWKPVRVREPQGS